MSIYEKSKVGRVMAVGGEHIVREYGKDRVIKFSLLFFLLGRHAITKAEKDVELCRRFFGQYFLSTEVAISPNGKHVVHIQPNIFGRALRVQDIKDSFVKNQFDEIIKGYNALVETGCAEIDLIGRGGVFRRCLSNIFITEDKKLLIIDGTIWDAEGYVGLFIYPLRKFAMWRQNIVLRSFICQQGSNVIPNP